VQREYRQEYVEAEFAMEPLGAERGEIEGRSAHAPAVDANEPRPLAGMPQHPCMSGAIWDIGQPTSVARLVGAWLIAALELQVLEPR
jgi:hypothetical protein